MPLRMGSVVREAKDDHQLLVTKHCRVRPGRTFLECKAGAPRPWNICRVGTAHQQKETDNQRTGLTTL